MTDARGLRKPFPLRFKCQNGFIELKMRRSSKTRPDQSEVQRMNDETVCFSARAFRVEKGNGPGGALRIWSYSLQCCRPNAPSRREQDQPAVMTPSYSTATFSPLIDEADELPKQARPTEIAYKPRPQPPGPAEATSHHAPPTRGPGVDPHTVSPADENWWEPCENSVRMMDQIMGQPLDMADGRRDGEDGQCFTGGPQHSKQQNPFPGQQACSEGQYGGAQQPRDDIRLAHDGSCDRTAQLNGGRPGPAWGRLDDGRQFGIGSASEGRLEGRGQSYSGRKQIYHRQHDGGRQPYVDEPYGGRFDGWDRYGGDALPHGRLDSEGRFGDEILDVSRFNGWGRRGRERLPEGQLSSEWRFGGDGRFDSHFDGRFDGRFDSLGRYAGEQLLEAQIDSGMRYGGDRLYDGRFNGPGRRAGERMLEGLFDSRGQPGGGRPYVGRFNSGRQFEGDDAVNMGTQEDCETHHRGGSGHSSGTHHESEERHGRRDCTTSEYGPGKQKRQSRPSHDKKWKGRRDDSGDGHGRRARNDGVREGKVVSANTQSHSTASSAEEGHQPPSAFTDLAGSIRRIPDGTYNNGEDLPEEIEMQIAAIENTRGTISGRDQTEVLSAVLETTRLQKRKLEELLSIVQSLGAGTQPGSGA